MSLIYSLEFSNGKKYIGMTAETLSRRMAVHRMTLKHSEAAVYRAWRKYGDPKANVLAFVEKHMLRDTERKAIAVFGTMVPNGYNLVAGGEGGGVSAETRKKMSLARKGRKKPPEFGQQLALRNVGNSYALGRKQSPEHISKRIAAHLGAKRSPEFRARMSAIAKNRSWKWTDERKHRVSESMKAARATRPDWPTRKKEIQ